MSSLERELEFSKSICRQVGSMLLANQGPRRGPVAYDTETTGEGHHAIHTLQDASAEAELRRALTEAFPKDSILGEEEGLTTGTSNRTWVFDPLDGSSHYTAGCPSDWSVALGLWEGSEQQLGVVYAPGNNELFFAIQGQGAYCDGASCRKLSVAQTRSIKDSIVSFGVCLLHNQPFIECGLLLEAGAACRTPRVVRSGDLDLAFCGAGRIDALFNWRQKPWDCVGALVLIEAGGLLKRFDPAKNEFITEPYYASPLPEERVSYIASCTKELETEFLAIIERRYRGLSEITV